MTLPSNAALLWVLDQKNVLSGVERSLKHCGRLLFQMAGKGNASAVLEAFNDLMVSNKYRGCFEGFTFPYSFLTPQEYRQLLVQVGLEPIRAELISKDMKFPDTSGLTGWIRTNGCLLLKGFQRSLETDSLKTLQTDIYSVTLSKQMGVYIWE